MVSYNGDIVIDEHIPFTCTLCGATNHIDFSSIKEKLGKTRVILFCRVCGRVHEPQRIGASAESGQKERNWLRCIPFSSPDISVPRGRSINAATGETFWSDSRGFNLTSEQFMMKHGINPEIYWRNKADLSL
jgi:hypothetical protein